ncbi:polyglutamine-binding protein 1 [Plakobranchus ocellatus]|uniref:Polyglutamine-binding protein 1 n=1 Tax=Plakobranchus ocellatus TaxID=259542 RepID=A0AAV3XXV5_9GAST|nr:polyglutamine-binding protein 1 [Plakobranchus ocellatus]
MPLPPALLARLAKRGIVEEDKVNKPDTLSGSTKPEEVEEVFAEDYDDPSKLEQEEQINEEITEQQSITPTAPVLLAPEVRDIVGDAPVFYETTACPNRSNPYHECVPYCKKRYGMREWDPDDDMTKRRDRMLRRYPLPEGWVEVGDYDSGRYYYWNVHTDEVSWLSPTHPKATVSKSAESLGLVGKIGNLDSDGEENMDISQDILHSDHEAEEQSSEDSDTSLSDEEEPPQQDIKRSRNRGRHAQSKKDELDPMDPAAYSDIPRGGWSEGLDQRGKAKTGVDVTASGPLFQQRPYPSPGDILRANQGLKKKK